MVLAGEMECLDRDGVRGTCWALRSMLHVMSLLWLASGHEERVWTGSEVIVRAGIYERVVLAYFFHWICQVFAEVSIR